MKRPTSKLEKQSEKSVGKHVSPFDAFAFSMKLQEAAVQLWREGKIRGVPKGVYRFKTHEEADEWTSRMLARSDAKKR
jgi:hypothetical protein